MNTVSIVVRGVPSGRVEVGSCPSTSASSTVTTRPRSRGIVYSGYVSLLGEGELGEEADAYIEKGDDEEALVAMIRAVAAAARRQGA